MPQLDNIIAYINQEIVANSLSGHIYQEGAYYGIAQNIPRTNVDGREELLPVIVSNIDEEIFCGIDDIHPIIIYHKTGSITSAPEAKYNYGRDQNIISETAVMQMIVFGDRARLLITPEALYAAIIAGFPRIIDRTIVSGWNLRMVSIKALAPNFNSRSVFIQEYSGSVDYKLKPNNILFQINYTIATRYDKSCFVLCAA